MISVFDIEKLRNLLKNFYEITHIRIAVFDENRKELVSYPDCIAPFCEIVRSTETGRLSCAQCDREACDKAASQRTTKIYRCHAGLTEAVTPIIVQDVLVGFLFFGHVFSYPDHASGWETISTCIRDLPVNVDQLKEAALRQPLITENYVSSATQIMSAVASYLVLEQMATLQNDQLAVRLDHYLTEHFTENFTAADLCEHFQIGKTHLYEISKRLYGCGIAEQIRKLRIQLARNLLQEKKLNLTEIAERCGYNDYNYFISVFTRVVGVSPKKWAAENQHEFS